MVWILVAGLGHGCHKLLPGILTDAHAHFLAERYMLIPDLLQLPAPVRSMQDVIQGDDELYHQKMPDRGGRGGNNFTLIDEPQFGEKSHRIFTGATHHPLDSLLARHGLQRHCDQRTETLILHLRMHRQKAYRGFIISIDIKSPHCHRGCPCSSTTIW